MQARQLSDTGVLGPLKTVAPPGTEVFGTATAIDGAGRSIVAWERYQSGGKRLQTRTLSAAGALGAVTSHGPLSISLSTYDIAVNATGVTQLVWLDLGDYSVWARVATTGTAGGVFSSIRRVSPAIDDARALDLALDGSGNARIIWYATRTGDSTGNIRTRVHSAAGALQAIQSVSSDAGATPSSPPRVSVNPSGAAAIVWFRNPPGDDNDRVQVSVGP